MGAAWLTVLLALLQVIATTATTKYDCKNSMITDEWRESVQTLHNTLRRRLAKGEQLGKDNAVLPVGRDIRYLYWDCNMEAMAEVAIQNCPATPEVPMPPDVDNRLGVIYDSITVKKQCNATTTALDLIETWWNEGAKKQSDENRVEGNDKFAQLIYTKSQNFACTYLTCGTTYHLLCLYEKDATHYVAVGSYLYGRSKSNPPITDVCQGCRYTPQEPIQCEDYLCHLPFYPIEYKGSKICPTCGHVIREDFRVTALEMHNYYRRLLATGWAKDAKIQYAKPAKAMNALVYDSALENAAVNYTQQCKNVPELSSAAGESFWTGSYDLSHVDAMKEAMKAWWGPLETTGLGDNVEYTSGLQQGDLKYFANIAHDETTKIGCAVNTCKREGFTVVSCRYSPAVILNNPIYKTGKKPCTPCPSGTSCSNLGGLCEASSP